MAHLAHTAVTDIRQAIRDKRSTFVVGPSRSGLTWLVNQSAALGVEPVVRFSVRGVRETDHVRASVASALRLSTVPQRPSDLQLALAQMDAAVRPRLVVVNDCHQDGLDAIAWLLAAAMDPVAGVGRTAVPFVFEGAFDPDVGLSTAFPAEYFAQPLVHYVDPAIPWRVLTEVEEIMRGRWRHSFSPGLIPWLSDVSGGDVGFVRELLERLPNEGPLRDDALRAAVRYVTSHGARAREIRESLKEIDDVALLRVVATGQGIPALVPSTLEPCALKKAYFAGIVVFDGIAGVYRVRGPITAHVVAQAIGLDAAATVFEGRFILGRLLIFFAHIAAFELDLRSSLRAREPCSLAAGVSTETGLLRFRKRVRDLVVQICEPKNDVLARLSEALKETLPESRSVLDYVRDQLGEEPTGESLLEGVTFAQLTRVARKADIVGERDEPLLAEINGYRNAFAHFRAESYGRCERLLQVISDARRALESRPLPDQRDRPAGDA